MHSVYVHTAERFLADPYKRHQDIYPEVYTSWNYELRRAIVMYCNFFFPLKCYRHGIGAVFCKSIGLVGFLRWIMCPSVIALAVVRHTLNQWRYSKIDWLLKSKPSGIRFCLGVCFVRKCKNLAVSQELPSFPWVLFLPNQIPAYSAQTPYVTTTKIAW